MKRLIFLISFLFASNCFSQDTLLFQNYQYHEVIVDSTAFWDIGNTAVVILPNPTNDTTYYDVFKIILEMHSHKFLYSWFGDELAIGIGYQYTFIPCEFVTQPGRNVDIINSLSGRHSWIDSNTTINSYWPLGAAANSGELRMCSRFGTSPANGVGKGFMIIKVFYRERIVGSAN